jgi:hypothetical protein
MWTPTEATPESINELAGRVFEWSRSGKQPIGIKRPDVRMTEVQLSSGLSITAISLEDDYGLGGEGYLAVCVESGVTGKQMSLSFPDGPTATAALIDIDRPDRLGTPMPRFPYTYEISLVNHLGGLAFSPQVIAA